MKGVCTLSIEEFLNLGIEDQLRWLNKQRATKQLKVIEEELGAKAYVIEKPIKHAGYKYDNNLKRYVLHNQLSGSAQNEALEFLNANLNKLKDLMLQMEQSSEGSPLIIDQRILNNRQYKSTGLRIQEDVFKRFTDMYYQQFGYYKMQDVLSQALLEFCERYEKKES